MDQITIKKQAFVMFTLFSLMSALIVQTEPSANPTYNGFPENSDETLQIAVSILPMVEWVEEVGGEFVDVASLIPVGGSPATYSPTATNITFISNADVWFQNGLIPFDNANAESLIEQGKSGMVVVNLSTGLDLQMITGHTHDEDEASENVEESDAVSVDPHVWLSPTRAIQMIGLINTTLSTIDPSHASVFCSNAANYIAKLTVLNASIAEQMATVSNKNMLLFHPSWGYFASDFGLNIIALEEDGKDPSSSHYAEVLDNVQEYQVGVIFIQEEFSESVAQSFAEDACVEIVQLSPLASNYLTNLNSSADLIAEKLDQDPVCSSSSIPGYSVEIFLGIMGISIIAIRKKIKSNLD